MGGRGHEGGEGGMGHEGGASWEELSFQAHFLSMEDVKWRRNDQQELMHTIQQLEI